MRLKRTLRLAGLTFVAFILMLLNVYLKEAKRFPYGTGTNDRAFLNATWRMSSREVERANRATLVPLSRDWDRPPIMDKTRYRLLSQEDALLWGHGSEIEYSFFDDKLYGYYIAVTAYNADVDYSEIRETLEAQFGNCTNDPEMQARVLQSCIWDTPKQKVSLWIMKNEDQRTFHIGIRATYKPGVAEIDRAIETEKKSYF